MIADKLFLLLGQRASDQTNILLRGVCDTHLVYWDWQKWIKACRRGEGRKFWLSTLYLMPDLKIALLGINRGWNGSV
jgi:hypothetical protein